MATLMMTMTGEDILHQNTTLSRGSWEMMVGVYYFLPRIGEFLQRFVIQFYDYQTAELNLNFLLRTLDAILCLGFIWLATMVSVGRRLLPKLEDALIFLTIFCLFILSSHNEIFMMRFSYLHNYIPMLIALSAVSYIMFHHRDRPGSKIWPAVGLLIGAILGASNEIAPIAVLCLVVGWIAYERFKINKPLGEIIKKSPTRNMVVVGVILGLLFMLSSGAIAGRGDSAYGSAYGYVSLFSIFSDTVYATAKLTHHFIFNGRFLWLPLLAMVIFTLTELHLSRRRKNYQYVKIQILLLGFVFLYMLASSQIKVLDDLYPRFFSPVYFAMVVSFMTIAHHVIELLRPKPVYIAMVFVVPFTIGSLAVVDLMYSFRIARQEYGYDLEQIKSSEKHEICVIRANADRRYKSPLFGFTSFPPLEEWTSDFGSSDIYGKGVVHGESCSTSTR